MARSTVTLKVHIAWWVRWYISGVALRSLLTGREPDMGKVKATVMKGVRLS